MNTIYPIHRTRIIISAIAFFILSSLFCSIARAQTIGEWEPFASDLPASYVAAASGSDLVADSAKMGLARSTDGGLTWRTIFTASRDRLFRYISHPTPERIVVAVDSQVVDDHDSFGNPIYVYVQKVYTSGDGGATWKGTTFSTSPNYPTLRLSMHDAFNGMVMQPGEPRDTLFQTTDGGMNWSIVPLPDTITSNSGFCTGPGQYVRPLVMYDGIDRYSSTTDGGATWTLKVSAERVESVLFLTTLHGWGTGRGGDFQTGYHFLIKETTDGGATWTTRFDADHNPFVGGAIAFADSMHGFVEGKSIYRTTDGGSTWSVDSVGTGYLLSAMYPPSGPPMIASGSITSAPPRLTILKYTGRSILVSPAITTPKDSLNQPTELEIAWTPVQGAVSYDISIGDTTIGYTGPYSRLYGAPLILDSGIAGTSYHVALDYNRRYAVRVRARGAGIGGVWSADKVFITAKKNGALSTPTFSFPANGSAGQPLDFTLRWLRVPDAEMYDVEIGADADLIRLVVNGTGLTDTSLPVTGLEPNRKYYGRVRARDFLGASPWYADYSFTTGTSSGVAVDIAGPAGLAISPNPAGGNGHIDARFTLRKGMRVRGALVDLLGREVIRLADRDMDAGAATISISTDGLAPGEYFLRLDAEGWSAARPVTIAR